MGILCNQSPATVNFYMEKGHEHIDNLFGKGYARDNPDLLIAFIDACHQDYSFATAIADNNNELTREK